MNKTPYRNITALLDPQYCNNENIEPALTFPSVDCQSHASDPRRIPYEQNPSVERPTANERAAIPV